MTPKLPISNVNYVGFVKQASDLEKCPGVLQENICQKSNA